MGNSQVDNELKRIVYLCMLMATSILATMIVTLSIFLKWDIWMLPVIVAGTTACWLVYIMNQASQRTQIYVCGVFAMFLVFYYCIKIKTVYDCGTVIVIMIFVFTFLGDKVLIWAGIIVSVAGLTMNLITDREELLDFDVYSFLRTMMVYLMIPLSAFLIRRIVRAWSDTERKYLDKIDVLSNENERVNNFLANVSHEIRTPVSAVIGLSYVLQKEDLSEENMNKVKAISAAGHRVSEQISDILDFTEIDMGKMAVAANEYMVISMVNDLLNHLALSDNYGLELIVDIAPDVPSILIGDESKIRRILWHLVKNGYKYTKEGGVYIRISSIKREYGVNLILEVKDTGVGMSENEIENIYEKFYQVDSSRARTSGGLGLGIPIVNGLTKSMGGLLTIESSQGEGTAVKISIPQKVVDPKPGISLANSEKCVAIGFLTFSATGHPKIREYYMQMISHLSVGLAIPFYRVQSVLELEKLIRSTNATHLFVGTQEYQQSRRYINSLVGRVNVALIADYGLDEEIDQNITVLNKPFYGTQIVNFLNQVSSGERIEGDEIITFPGTKALVVDDEHMNLIVAREIFKAYEMEITTASGGEEAIKLCQNNDYDIVFMDHMMPGMDGVEAMHIIKQNAAKIKKEICVIALTANAISTAREMFISEGFDGFVPKPIEISELERTLRRVLPNYLIVHKGNHKKTNKVDDTEEVKVQAEKGDSKEVTKEVVEEAVSEKKDIFAQLQELGVDTAYGIDYCAGDEDFYKELLTDYADNKESKISELKQYFDTKDLKNYEIRVHAIKSTSKIIGALELSDEAKALEFAAKGGDEGLINEKHPDFMQKYENLMKVISEGGAQ